MMNNEMNNEPLDPESFDLAYKKLKENAEWFSSEKEPKIDDLLQIVQESTQAYHICKNRLEAIRQALEQHLGSDREKKSAITTVNSEEISREKKPMESDDDGLPF